ncbi:MAG: hypothetical protein KA368_13120 [Acidobacteria bacterium]|nr:hypothetical protein [Acidobacteriota bacterium]
MLTVEGVYSNGRVEFSTIPPSVNQTKVLVTFIELNEIDLATRGINEEQAADLSARLSAFAEEWNRPEMDVYDED